MPRRTTLPIELACRPFTVGEAHRLGLGEGRLRNADLSRPTHGVRQAGTDPDGPSLVQVAEATQLVLPVGSAFSHLTAARLLGLPVPRRWAQTEPLGGRGRRLMVEALPHLRPAATRRWRRGPASSSCAAGCPSRS